jgi:hypothetical protein
MSACYRNGLGDAADVLKSVRHGEPGGGQLHAIWVKRMRQGPMDGAEAAVLRAGRGLVGNANHGGRRQVTVMELEAWDAFMRQLGASLPTSARRPAGVRGMKRDRRSHVSGSARAGSGSSGRQSLASGWTRPCRA